MKTLKEVWKYKHKIFKLTLFGDNDLLRIADVDRVSLARRNAMAVVVSVDDGFYKLATIG